MKDPQSSLGKAPLTKHLLCAKHCETLYIHYFEYKLHNNSSDKYSSHFIGEETEACKDLETCKATPAACGDRLGPCVSEFKGCVSLTAPTTLPLPEAFGMAFMDLQRFPPFSR